MKRRTTESGFTLLELLMVVIIIAILAALALPAYFRAVEKARTSEATLAMGAIKGAVQRYCVENAGNSAGLSLATIDVENPGVQPNAQYTYAMNVGVPPATSCVGVNGYTVDVTATRFGGPCGGSTVQMLYPPTNAGGSPFVYTWAAGSPCS